LLAVPPHTFTPGEFTTGALTVAFAAAVLGGFTSLPEGLSAQPASVTAAETATIGLLEVSYLPTINLTGGFTEYDSRFPPSGQGVGSVSLIVTWPLWDRGQREIAVQQAKTNLNVARAVSADLERAASRDVTQAAEAYRISREAMSLTQLQLVAAQETFRVQELRYKSGANTILDLLEAQFQLTRAESEAVQSVYALYLSLAGLEAITGQEFLVERNQ